MNKKVIWIIWICVSLVLAGFFANKLFGEGDKSTFLIGEATHGHFQIEMACETCHTDPFGGEDILQEACTQCHAAELEEAHDSHPKSKFTDPRNADRIEILDARYCVNCHTEHQKEKTHAMGVTLPDDYCWHCHQELGEERPSHQGLEFTSCASAGCHNYHDNRALYEDFLVENTSPHWLTEPAADEEPANSLASTLEKHPALDIQSSRYQQEIQTHPELAQTWEHSSHAAAGVDCGGCHIAKEDLQWVDKPNHEQCQVCHKNETAGFLAGKHGMRLSGELSATLEPMSPAESQMDFKDTANTLTHGCNSCHGAHDFNPQKATVEACLGCHNDQHSQNYLASPHGQQWQTDPNSPRSVTCASCHMPRLPHGGKDDNLYLVQHNQNWNLRPNEKMIRPVCMDCHSLDFAIDALADSALIENNFKGKPQTHVESIEWALKRAQEK